MLADVLTLSLCPGVKLFSLPQCSPLGNPKPFRAVRFQPFFEFEALHPTLPGTLRGHPDALPRNRPEE